MNRIHLAVAALPLLLLYSCSDSEAAGNKPEIFWPADGAKIFVDTPIRIDGVEADSKIAVLLGGEGLAAGTTVGEDVQVLLAGTAESLNLTPGDAQLTFQLIDAEGNSLGLELAVEASYTVVSAPPERRVFFVEPADGAKVKSPFKVEFGLIGMGLTPASEAATIPDKTQGHHHIIIHSGPLGPGELVPADATNIHYGLAETETELELEPGKYSLTLQFADGLHMSYGASMAATIQIEVIE